MSLRDQLVQFKICDIYIPDPQTVLWKMHANALLQGRVIDLSDSGQEENVFAVIEVEGIEQLLIVPVSRLSVSS